MVIERFVCFEVGESQQKAKETEEEADGSQEQDK